MILKPESRPLVEGRFFCGFLFVCFFKYCKLVNFQLKDDRRLGQLTPEGIRHPARSFGLLRVTVTVAGQSQGILPNCRPRTSLQRGLSARAEVGSVGCRGDSSRPLCHMVIECGERG